MANSVLHVVYANESDPVLYNTSEAFALPAYTVGLVTNIWQNLGAGELLIQNHGNNPLSLVYSVAEPTDLVARYTLDNNLPTILPSFADGDVWVKAFSGNVFIASIKTQ